jgi:hypothetical protein
MKVLGVSAKNIERRTNECPISKWGDELDHSIFMYSAVGHSRVKTGARCQ